MTGARTKACAFKSAYESDKAARTAAKRESKRTGHVIRGYHCQQCGAYHIGHASTRGHAKRKAPDVDV